MLTQQDQHRPRLHVTIQNKVAAKEAKDQSGGTAKKKGAVAEEEAEEVEVEAIMEIEAEEVETEMVETITEAETLGINLVQAKSSMEIRKVLEKNENPKIRVIEITNANLSNYSKV